MRLSADPKSPYYRADLIGNVKVLLDGSEVNFAWEVNESDGWIRVFARNSDGDIFLGEDGEIATETLRGTVKIVMPGVRLFKRGQF